MVNGIRPFFRYIFMSGALLFFVACGPKDSAPIQDFTGEEPFDRRETLATFDGYAVKIGEFVNAFTQVGNFDDLWHRASSDNETSYLVEVLQNLEDSRVFAQWAMEEGYVDSSVVEDYVAQTRFDKIINLYYVREVLLKADVTEEELKEYYEKVKSDRFATPPRIKIKWIFISKNKWGWEKAEQRAKEVAEQLEGKREFDELLHTYSDSTDPQRFMDHGWYSRGDLESNPAFEDALFALKKVGEHTGPVRARNGFHFGKLTGIREGGAVSYANARLLIRDEVVQAKVEKKLAELIEKGMKSMTVERNFELLDQPDAKDDATLFRVENYRYPLGRFRSIALATGLDRRSDREQFLEQAIRNAIVYQFAVEAGYQRLDIESLCRPAVDEYLARIYLEKEVDDRVEVPETEILKYYQKHREVLVSQTKIRPFWILIRANVAADVLRYQKELAMREAKQQADQIYYGLIRRAGEPFTDLARKYSHHEPTRFRGGDLGIYEGGTMGHRFDEVAFAMQAGEISQPRELRNGYCIIWLRERFPSRPLTYDEARERIDQDLRGEKIYQRRNEIRREVRQGQRMKINNELLTVVADYLVKARDDLILRARLVR